MSFLKRLLTIRNLSRVITIFLIGIILRYIVNDCNNFGIIIEYIDLTSIIIGSILNYLFIEPWLYIHCKLYGYGLATSYINDNNKSNISNTYNYSNSHYYNAQGKIIISKPSELTNYNFDSKTRKSIVSQLFEEIAQPTKFREVVIPSGNATGEIYLGIKYCDRPSNVYGLYIKYYNLFNQEYTWNVWEKDSSGLEFSQVESIIHPKINVWKEIKDTTGTNVSKEVRKLLKTDPFHINKCN